MAVAATDADAMEAFLASPEGRQLLDAQARIRWARANGAVERVVVRRESTAQELGATVRVLRSQVNGAAGCTNAWPACTTRGKTAEAMASSSLV